MLEINNLTLKFGGLVAINNLTLNVKKGSIHSIIGPNGAGKSTLFNCISRLYMPNEGEILFEKESILGYKPYELAHLGIARSFQNTELFENMTLFENLLTGYYSNFKSNFLSILFNTKKYREKEEIARNRVEEVIDLLDLNDIKDEIVVDLPFGFQKMADIGRALMINPKLLLLDEPVAGLNSVETIEIMNLISRLKNQLGCSIMLIEHDMSLVMKISEHITVVNFGKEIASGKPEEIKNNEEVKIAYLGKGDES